MKNLEFWNKKLKKYSCENWADKPSIFAEWAVQYFPEKGEILDLGAGIGQDSIFFGKKGYNAVLTDFSETGLEIAKEKIAANQLENKITIKILDLEEKFPFGDCIFDVVYAHLSLHIFDDKTTKQIFSEIYRVLREEGILAVLVNSINDPEYNLNDAGKQGTIEHRGFLKRFFSKETLGKFTRQFKKIVLDDQGETYKDSKIGVRNLIRFIGKKKYWN